MRIAIRAAAALAAAIALAAAAAVWLAAPRLDDAEAAARIAAAELTWPDYSEEIKAQIGASLAASWRGRPLRAWREGGLVHALFVVETPRWNDPDLAFPVLMRDPAERVYRPHSVRADAEGLVYTFRLPPDAPDLLPFIELQYPPNEIRRMLLG